jgi:Tol biopolymer transport system component
MLSLSPKKFLFFSTFFVSWILSGHASAAETTRVSVGANNTQATGSSYQPSLSADGRYVAFTSDASNLVAGDTNATDDTFVYDRVAKRATRASVNSSGAQQSGISSTASISADGRYVAFASDAPNLVAGDTNNTYDVFIHDRNTQQTSRVSVGLNEAEGNDGSYYPTISADGRYVTFQSSAENLVIGDTNINTDTFVHDRVTKKTVRVSVDSNQMEADGGSFYPKISAGGRYVAFISDAPNLVANDTNNVSDSFIRDLKTNQTTRVSINSREEQQNSDSFDLHISADGRYVAFESFADNLVDGDTNNAIDSFVHDRRMKKTVRVSVNSNGAQGDQDSVAPRLSADGRYVLFESRASTLASGDTNKTLDVFVHDRKTSRTSLVSVGSKDTQGNEVSLAGSISADGNIVAFQSFADNLIKSDTNASMDVFVNDRMLDTEHHADLQITATKQPKELVRNSYGTFTYTITNNGPDTVNDVRVIYLASGGRDASFRPSQGRCKNLNLSGYIAGLCGMGELASGNSLTLTVVAKASRQLLRQKVTVSSKLTDKVPTNNAVSVSTTVKRCCNPSSKGKVENRD